MQQIDIEGFRPSIQQTSLWQAKADNASAYLCAQLGAGIDASRLRRALESAVGRHEILRTSLQVVPGMQLPVQVIAEDAAVAWREIEAGQAGEVLAQMRAATGQAGRPALAAALLRDGQGACTLLLAAPATVADAETMQLLLQELEHEYGTGAAADPEVQYADFAEWQHELLASPEGSAARAFWSRQDDGGAAKPRHPFERRGAAGPFIPAQVVRGAGPAWTDRLLSAAAGLQATPGAILAACWNVLLQRQLGLSPLAIGWRHGGRSEATMAALGPYARTLPLLVRASEDMAIGALARAHDAQMAEAALYHEFATPVALQYAVEIQPAAASSGTWQVAGAGCTGLPFALALRVDEGDEYRLSLAYDQGRFSAQAAELLLEQVLALAGEACRQPDAPMRAIGGLDEAQAARLASFNRPGEPNAACGSLHELFERQAARRPEAIAVEYGDQTLRYGELNARANRLAHRLRSAGLSAGAPVGLFAGRSLEAVVGMLGILKAGGAYLPLDPAYPSERLAFMLEDAAASLVLATSSHAAALPGGAASVVVLDDEAALAGFSAADPAPLQQPQGLAYIIYTSGSTGQPKGVMVSHLNAVQSTMARWQEYDVECESFLLSSSFSFDSSIAGLFWTLSQGGRLCLPADEAVQDPSAMASLVGKHRASHALMLASFYSQVLESGPDSLASLRCVIVAGEACPAALVARHQDACPQARLYNEYGPTEGSVWCTLHRAGNEDGKTGGVLPIGRAIGHMRIYVLDRQFAQVPQGIAGEIYIGGAGIARGYLRRPALTAERFLPDPFGPPGARLYRTGDIGRYDAEGCLEFLGRVDHQVKIRGFRIELGEIEARLAEHPAVREAAVAAKATQDGEWRLVAYIVARGASPASALLQEHLQRKLPAHMVPGVFVMLQAMPLTPNGKVDRAALPEPGQGSRPAYVAPRNELEAMLARTWEEILGVENVGAADDFFALGGHSLVATRLVSRVRSLLGRDIAVRSVFQHPCLADFARHVGAQAENGAAPLVRADRSFPLPLSYPQQRLWQFDREHPGSTVYNVPSAVRLLGELDRDAMQRAFDELLRRHEALRTTFPYDEQAGMPVQSVQPATPVALAFADLGALSPQAQGAETLRILAAEENTPFDLAHGPLLRAGLVRASQREHTLWITLHHIVSDRWSMQVLVRELGALYEAFSLGKPSPLAEPAFQYADFAAWQRSQVDSGALARQLDYWKGQLRADQPPLQLPGMRPRPAQQSHRGDTWRLDIGSELAAQIHALCRQQGATLFMTMLAAFKAVLALRSGESDVPVGILLANRNRTELEGLTGCLINMLALRTDLAPGQAFSAYLAGVRDSVLAAQANQDVPFERVVQAVQPVAQPGCPPLFQVLFDVHQERILQQPGMGGLAFADAPEPASPTTHFDLMVGVGEREDGLRLSIVYCTDLFDEATIADLGRDYVRLLQAAASAPGAAIRLPEK